MTSQLFKLALWRNCIIKLENEVLREVGMLARCIQSISDITYREINLQRGQFIFLTRICESPGVNLIELSNILKVDKATTTKVVQKLMKEDYVLRERYESDKRGWHLYPSGNGNFWVALYNGRVVGTLALIDIGNHQGALRKMFVKPAFRGSKYNTAKLLLLQLFTWVREYDVHDIYLGTTELFLAAHRFYAKHKFVQIKKETLPDTFPIMKVDTKFYQLKIINN